MVTDIIDVRFAFVGKIASVNKHRGDEVKRGEFLASLDRKGLQADLDKQLAAYEQQRAQFEIFAQKNPNPGDDITMYLKKIQQAQLNASVKEVELAKMRLDEADLICPVNGVVVDDGANRPGQYATPASNSYKIWDSDSKRVEVELDEKEAGKITPGEEITVEVSGEKIKGKAGKPFPEGKGWVMKIYLTPPSP